MAGHSKWANIKRQKGVNDQKRAAVFTKMSRLLTVSAREGGGDPDSNPKLRLAIEKAKEARMPKENIQRAIDRGSSRGDGSSMFDVVYEGFGPSGSAFIVLALTDNKNRTVSEIRTIFSKAGGSMGAVGSTSYIFGEDPENPQFQVGINDTAELEKLSGLMEELYDQSDVSEVYANFVGEL